MRKRASTTKQGPKKRQAPKQRQARVPSDREILNADQAADALGITKRVLLKLAGAGRIPGEKLGREWRFNRKALRTIGTPRE